MHGGGRDAAASSWKTHNYSDAVYWDERYREDGDESSFDWYQRYSALRPFIRYFLPTNSSILMAGCGNAVISEDMVKDGYKEIINIDISAVAIEIMRKKYALMPQLKYMQMDVRDMSFFPDGIFDSVIDKGTLDSLMCGTDAPLSASQMVEEVNRVLKPGGIYMLISYGGPSARIPHLHQEGCSWKIILYIIPRPGFVSTASSSSTRSPFEPVPLTENSVLPASFVLEDPESHYIYVCKKMDGVPEDNDTFPESLVAATIQ